MDSVAISTKAERNLIKYSQKYGGEIPNQMYTLYATGVARVDGREQIALPKHLVITPEIKREFNIIWTSSQHHLNIISTHFLPKKTNFFHRSVSLIKIDSFLCSFS